MTCVSSDEAWNGIAGQVHRMALQACVLRTVLDGQEGPVARDCEQKQGDVCVER